MAAPGSLTNIAHELANSINAISSTVQLLERDLKTHRNNPQEVISAAITNLKNECSRMEIYLRYCVDSEANMIKLTNGSKQISLFLGIRERLESWF
jgi:nitrogen-specific signal transduction histidine kinase